ncbi:DUF4105 domain-containing protein [Porticoccaceae bacterium LTM1]|nr:DUF4105 domain-containing protein [Porticoccaceae bacterium LTM1]
MRKLASVILALLVLLSFSSSSSALEFNALKIDSAKLEQLSRSSTWHKLMLYESNSQSHYGVESAIHTDDFFLAADGRHNPLAELQATLNALSVKNISEPDSHAQCKFRGRYVWLDQQLGLSSRGIEMVECPRYESWSLEGKTESVSLMFATGYLGNPASYYGHVLLKLNSTQSGKPTKLEDVTVNYGAIVPAGEGPLPYIFKGLFGGYDAGFSHIQYYFHNHNYGENELRDMWEYELNLTPSELDLVLGHAWEVLFQKYQYFFAKKNCAYRVAEILEVVDGIILRPNELMPWFVPQALIQSVSRIERNGEPVIKSVQYHPSRQTRLYKRYSNLSSTEKAIVESVVRNIDELEGEGFDSLNLTAKLRVLDTLLDYFQFIRDAELLAKDVSNTYYRRVLAKRYLLPPGEVDVDMDSNDSPHKGRSPSLAGVEFIHNQVFGTGIGLHIRPVYYDALDADFGHVNNASLSMGEMRLAVFDGQVQLRQLEIFSVESVNAAVTGLPGDEGNSWKLGLGLRQQSLDCEHCLATVFWGDLGHTLQLSDQVLIGGYLGGGIQESQGNSGSLYAKSSVFLNMKLADSFRVRLTAEYLDHVDGDHESRLDMGAHLQYRISRDWSIRAYYEDRIVREVGVSLNLYW